MLSVLSSVLGGIGLFLLGMILMTDGLKALAGDSLKTVLSRFTKNRFSAVATGTVVTALVQSSSATTLATIGFVSAGLLGFGNAVGVMLGANLGTTSTGWLVGLLGLKLSIGSLLLPCIGIGALARLVGRGRIAQAGTALAGFGVIFVGIDFLQAGMQGLATHLDLAAFAREGLGARALLVLVGMVMTILMQSSSAAVATTLAALSAGTIDLGQAAALVVGQNVGTTVTAGIAAIGATAAAKRTAFTHVLFNCSTGLIAFFLLPVFVAAIGELAVIAWEGDPTLTLAAFHTAFNLVGLAVFLPLTETLARFTERILPERRSPFTARLDPSLLGLPPVALEAAQRSQARIGTTLFRMLSGHLREARPPDGATIDEMDLALDEVRRFLGRIEQGEDQGGNLARQVSAMHINEHLERLVQDARKAARHTVPEKLAIAKSGLSGLLEKLAGELDRDEHLPDVEAVRDFSLHLAEERRADRSAILEATAARRIDPDAALAALAAQRWLDRIAFHAWRCGHHFRVAQGAADGGDPGRHDKVPALPDPEADQDR